MSVNSVKSQLWTCSEMNTTILTDFTAQFMENLPANIHSRLDDLTTMRAFQLGLGLVVLGQLYRSWRNRISVPRYGGVVSFSSILSTIRLSIGGHTVWSEYYSKYPMVMMPSPDRWHLVVRDEFVDEINRAPDNVLSSHSATEEALQIPHTLGSKVTKDEYHLSVIRNLLTRHLHVIFPEVYDEIKYTFENDAKINSSEWKELEVFPWVLQVVAKVSNRVFVGAPLCRDPEWLSIVVDGAVSVVKTATIINLFPVRLRNIVGWLLSRNDSRILRGSALAKDVIEAHMNKEDESEKEDFLDWLISAAPPEERNVKDITRRIVAINFAAIHTSSLNLTHALYWLTARPEYLEPMREEIEAVTNEMGWSKNAFGHMPKVESFMKECMRFHPLATNAMNKRVLKPFTFSNGVSPPIGTVVSAHIYGPHMNESIYANSTTFDGFRFVKPEGDVEGQAKETMYSTSASYMAFSHGRHACPGRFFASMELKIMFAYLVAHYDFSWPVEVTKNLKQGERYRPKDFWFGGAIIPDPTAKILIRKRSVNL